MAEGWERVELYPRAEGEEYMTFATTRVYYSLGCVRWVYHGHFLFSVFYTAPPSRGR